MENGENIKRWLVDARTLASRPTGIGMYAYRHIKRLISEGHAVELVADVAESTEIADLKRRGAIVHVYGTRVFNSAGVLAYFKFLKRVIAAVKPDVFWQPNNLQPFKPKGVPHVIVTMHDVFGLKDWSWQYALWHLYYRFNFSRTLRNVTEVWFNSKETQQAVEAMASRALSRLVSKVVYPITEVPRREDVSPCPLERPYFLYVGNIEVRKGADLLIAAYRRYRHQGGTNDLVFAGIEKNVRIPRTEGITVLGYVDDATKFSLMCSCAAFIVPSRAEGYGMQVAEAAALKVPTISSDLSVFKEIDPTSRTTFPSEDVDALASLMLQAHRG